MVNRYRPHIYVVPEDDANRQILNGFLLEPGLDIRAIQVLPSAGGWSKVRDDFEHVYAPEMQNYPLRMMLLVIDFDKQGERLNVMKQGIPGNLNDRVFVLGVLSEPEQLKRATGLSLESIGQGLATDCSNGTYVLWGHDLLRHNKAELQRMVTLVKPFLFG